MTKTLLLVSQTSALFFLMLSLVPAQAVRPGNPAESLDTAVEASGTCTNCEDTSSNLPIELVGGKKKKKSRCPFGVGPMNKTRCDKSLETKIRKVLGEEHVACYSKLFHEESTCQTVVTHDKRKAKNPHAGFGLCAIETSPALRANRPKACHGKIASSTEKQIACCRALMVSTNAKYFGTVICGKTPRCH